MPVYVDPMRASARASVQHLVCSLYADDPEELGPIAAKLGLRESDLIGGALAHYEITIGKRKSAMRLGAIEHSSRDKNRWLYARRQRRPDEKRSGSN
jgi:hypothetical protein